jgi:membrane protein YqaA with SNARE-associated domain
MEIRHARHGKVRTLLERITAFLVEFGPLGVFLLGFIDSAGVPVAAGMDALIIVIGIKAPERAYLTALLAVVGSIGGNLVLFSVARRGGRRLAERRAVVAEPAPPGKFSTWFDRYGLLTVFIPALVPIPLPLKVFVISAGVLNTKMSHFLGVIAVARVVRYFGEAYLAIQLGEGARDFLVRNAWNLLAFALALGLALYLLIRLNDRRRATAR